jgi:DNA-binding NarL/FixJ family response regulator
VASEPALDSYTAGAQAVARAEWESAKESFEQALALAPDDPRALDGLGVVLVYLGDTQAGREMRERAYVEHRRRGDPRSAAAAAVFVAWEYRISHNDAAAAGWLARAERCLAGVDACAELGAIEIERAKQAPEPADAERHARRALALARDLQDPDLEIAALSQVGVALVRSGRWEDGMALLDEAMAGAMGGEATDTMAVCDTCCQTLVACEQIADLRRASEWCRVVMEFSERRRFTPMHAWCRAVYAGVLMATGEWEHAERELLESLRRYETRARIMGDRALPLAGLADLRLRQGRPEEAQRLLEGYEDHPVAFVPVARLRVLQGDAAAAAATIERRLAALGADAPAAAPLLPVLVDARLALDDVPGAGTAARALVQLGERLRRDNLRALGLLASGRVAAAGGDATARATLEAALDLFVALGMPFEEATARLALARLFVAEGSELAVVEAQHALAIFERLGAARSLDEAAALLRSLGARGRSGPRAAEPLTTREREVLALLGEGLTNAQIAERLVISEKTAGHHVSRIYRKLGVRNRTQAAAYALRDAAQTSSAS